MFFTSESQTDVGGLGNASQDLTTKSQVIFMFSSLQHSNQYTLPRFNKTTSDTQVRCHYFWSLKKKEHLKYPQQTEQKPILENSLALPVSH